MGMNLFNRLSLQIKSVIRSSSLNNEINDKYEINNEIQCLVGKVYQLLKITWMSLSSLVTSLCLRFAILLLLWYILNLNIFVGL